MASKLGISVPTYSNADNGYSDSPIEVIQDFCIVIGISKELFYGKRKTVNDIFDSDSDILYRMIQLEKGGFKMIIWQREIK